MSEIEINMFPTYRSLNTPASLPYAEKFTDDEKLWCDILRFCLYYDFEPAMLYHILDLLLENIDKNSIEDFVGSGLLVFQHVTGIFIGLGVHVFDVLGCTRTNDVISKDNRSSVQNVERLDQFHIRYIQVLPVIDENGINLANVVRVVLEEVTNGAIE